MIQSVKFIKSSGEIGTEPPGSELNPDWHWTGQYEEDVMKEEKYHLKQFRGEVSPEMGGQVDCFTQKGVEYFARMLSEDAEIIRQRKDYKKSTKIMLRSCQKKVVA